MRLLTSFLLCLYMVSSFAQKGQLTGRVIDKQSNEAMIYVTVSVHELVDTSLVTGGITDKEGRFKIDDVILGKSYLFKCSFIGYGTIYQTVDFTNTKSINLGEIILFLGNEMLEGVEVFADKPVVTY